MKIRLREHAFQLKHITPRCSGESTRKPETPEIFSQVIQPEVGVYISSARTGESVSGRGGGEKNGVVGGAEAHDFDRRRAFHAVRGFRTRDARTQWAGVSGSRGVRVGVTWLASAASSSLLPCPNRRSYTFWRYRRSGRWNCCPYSAGVCRRSPPSLRVSGISSDC